MPEVRRCHHALLQNLLRIVLAPLKFVAHHGHFGIQELFFDPHLHHAVRFQAKRPLEIVVARIDGFKIVGAIVIRGPVPLRAVIGELFLDASAVGGQDEVHVLQQMSHPCLAVSFKSRAH